MKKYIFAITYNFDTSYVTKCFNTYEEAIAALNSYLEDEVNVINTECEYNPSVLRWTEDDVTLVYAEDYDVENTSENYALENCAYYRVFEVEI